MKRSLIAFLLVVPGTGCATWHTTADLDQVKVTADSAATFDVWGKDGHRKLRALRIDTDSVYGLPGEWPSDCSTCPVAIPRAEVDSIRGETRDTAEMGIVVLVTAVMLFPVWFIMMLPHS
jgi:hypothetical protein